jgi:hypothetical protein
MLNFDGEAGAKNWFKRHTEGGELLPAATKSTVQNVEIFPVNISASQRLVAIRAEQSGIVSVGMLIDRIRGNR